MKIAADKWKHFFVGVVMGAVLQAFFSFLLDGAPGLPVLLALIFSSVVAYGFELVSKFTGKGHYDLGDAVATMFGAVPGIGVIVLIQVL